MSEPTQSFLATRDALVRHLGYTHAHAHSIVERLPESMHAVIQAAVKAAQDAITGVLIEAAKQWEAAHAAVAEAAVNAPGAGQPQVSTEAVPAVAPPPEPVAAPATEPIAPAVSEAAPAPAPAAEPATTTQADAAAPADAPAAAGASVAPAAVVPPPPTVG